MAKHRRPGAQIVLSDSVKGQARNLTPAEAIAVDRALAALSADPTIGVMRIKPEHGGLMWEYRAPGTSVRIVYTMTIRRTIVTVAYFEA